MNPCFEYYDGSSWTEVADLQNAVNSMGAASQGTPSSALIYGGYSSPGPSNRTEEFDGTSWAETANLNTSRSAPNGSGIQTAALASGGEPPSTIKNVESYNGSTWTETSYDMGSGGYWGAYGGSSTSAFVAGRVPYSNITEEWASGPTAATVTTS